MSPPQGPGNDGPEHAWLDDDDNAVEGRPADAANLVSLGFIAAALRRSAWFWRVMAVVGLLAGAGWYLKAPPTYQASTRLWLTVGAESQPGTAILEDQTLAQSNTVAGLTLRNLGLNESVSSFLGSYTVTPLTDRILQITASAPSSNEAVRRASALAKEFLAFRANQLLADERLESAALDQQIAEDKQRLTSSTRQTSQVSAPPGSSSRRAKTSARGSSANNDLAALEQNVIQTEAQNKVTTATMIGGSKVLDVASPVPPHSRKKRLLLYAGGGFVFGLILAMIIIVVRALLSERLRRRDDVAQALGAPVRSVPAMRGGRLLTGRSGRVSARHAERITAYLRDALPAGSRGRAALAVVPVDDPQVAAMSAVSMALSYAQKGARVVVADLCPGGPAAALLGVGGPGVSTVSVDGAQLVAAVPHPAEFAPIGPLARTSRQAQPAAGELAAAWASAELLLTLIPLDPSVGGDHLATWAADAVVVVTAGRSTWTKIHAVSEMVRLSGTRLALAVLIGADKTDESLGMALMPEVGGDAVSTHRVEADGEGSIAASSSGRLSDGPASMVQMDPPDHVGRRRRTGP